MAPVSGLHALWPAALGTIPAYVGALIRSPDKDRRHFVLAIFAFCAIGSWLLPLTWLFCPCSRGCVGAEGGGHHCRCLLFSALTVWVALNAVVDLIFAVGFDWLWWPVFLAGIPTGVAVGVAVVCACGASGAASGQDEGLLEMELGANGHAEPSDEKGAPLEDEGAALEDEGAAQEDEGADELSAAPGAGGQGKVSFHEEAAPEIKGFGGALPEPELSPLLPIASSPSAEAAMA